MTDLFNSLFTNFREEGNNGSFEFLVRDSIICAVLRRSMMEAVTSIAIGYIKVRSNPLLIHDETIGMYLAQLPLDNRQLTESHTRAQVRIQGPCVFSTYDIPLPFVYQAELFPLLKGQELDMEVITAPGQGYSHAKWQTICQCAFEIKDDRAFFTVELVGNLPLIDIVRQAFEMLPAVYDDMNQIYQTRIILVDDESIELMNALRQ